MNKKEIWNKLEKKNCYLWDTWRCSGCWTWSPAFDLPTKSLLKSVCHNPLQTHNQVWPGLL